jgi:hypothetical protein
MEPIPVHDLAGLAIACVALVVTAGLFVVGMRISSDFHKLSERIGALEEQRSSETRELLAFKAIAEISTRIQDSHLKFDMSVGEFLFYVAEKERVSSPALLRATAVLRSYLSEHEKSATRYIKYLSLLRLSSGQDEQENAHILLETICQFYPDEQTISFLSVIVPLLEDPVAKAVLYELEVLTKKVRGADSVRWSNHRKDIRRK